MAILISQNPATTTLLLVILIAILPTTTNSICSDLMASSLSSSGFTVFAHALHSHNITTAAVTTTRLTFLAPPDTALINRPFNNDSLHGHITDAGALHYQSLLTLAPNTTIPTLHNNITLVVGTDGKRVSFNDVLVVVPNLYIDGSCVVHGVDGPLVPIPSPMPQVSPSPPEVAGRHGANQFSEYVRFIRRENHSSHGGDGSESDEDP